ncbi:MAG: hypothetical protein RMY29_032890 [Nostoc sp. CreGUA01]|nr:hypothetical protein [Nostoc sp. CreGUA01]
MWEVWEDGEEIFPPPTPSSPSSPSSLRPRVSPYPPRFKGQQSQVFRPFDY